MTGGLTRSGQLIRLIGSNKTVQEIFSTSGYLKIEQRKVLSFSKWADCTIGCGAFKNIIKISIVSTTN